MNREVIPLDSNDWSGFSFDVRRPCLFGKDYDERLSRKRGFHQQGLGNLGKYLMEGMDISKAAELAGTSRERARSFRRVLVTLNGEIYCPCGKQSNHVGVCPAKYPSMNEHLGKAIAKRWHR